MNKTGVIYCIENKINNKMYIGQTIHPKIRLDKHKRQLRRNKHINSHLQNSWNKYGEENFRFKVLERKIKTKNIDKKEIYYIKKFNSYKNGYNNTPGGKEFEEATVKLICVVCGNEYKGYERQNNKYCSESCRQKANKKRHKVIRKCKICGKDFETSKYSNAKTCSNKCAGKLSWKKDRKKTTKVCKFCGEEYKTYWPKNSKFCSDKCQRDNKRKEKKYHETRECIICGKKFSVRKDTKTKTCSKSCGAKLAWRHRRSNKEGD